jgi:hypothetical protein
LCSVVHKSGHPATEILDKRLSQAKQKFIPYLLMQQWENRLTGPAKGYQRIGTYFPPGMNLSVSDLISRDSPSDEEAAGCDAMEYA